MKKYKYAISLLLFFAMLSLTGCSNFDSNAPLENKTIPESTTISVTTAEKESTTSETTSNLETAEESTSLKEENQETLTEQVEIPTESSTNEVTTIQKETTITEKETTLPVETTTAAPIILQGYLFESNGISIGMHEDAEYVLATLGTADAYFETPSCAFLGIDRQYTYGGYMLTTYEESGREYIYDIYFLDETIQTPEGIRIGSGMDEMIAAYGEGYTEDFGMYTYIKERSKLQFLIVDGVITSVDYTALTD